MSKVFERGILLKERICSLRTPNHGQETKTWVAWPCLKVFWFSKDDSAGHSEWKQKRRWKDNIKEWTGMDFARLVRAVKDRTKWKGVVAKSSVVPQ